MQKNRALFQTRFSSPTALRRFYSYTHKNHPGLSPICLLSFLKIWIKYLHSFRRSRKDNETLWKSEKWRYFATGSDIIKIKKNVLNISKYVSVLKISRKSVEPFSRNPLHKIRKKKNNNNSTRSRCEQRGGLPSDWPLKSQIT